MNTKRKIVFEHELEPDSSWLDQEEFKNEDKNNHVALLMSVYEMKESDKDWNLVDSLGNIDFLADSDDWKTGTFYHVGSLEGYQMDLAIEAGLPS